MESSIRIKSRSLQVAVLPMLVLVAGLCGQSALAGGNGSGQPSGGTLAGTATIPTATMSGLTSVIMTGIGSTTTVTTTPTSGGGTQTTTTVTVPASSVARVFSNIGVRFDPSARYQGVSGVTYSVEPITHPVTGVTEIRVSSHKITLGQTYNF